MERIPGKIKKDTWPTLIKGILLNSSVPRVLICAICIEVRQFLVGELGAQYLNSGNYGCIDTM
eukprot:2640916-Pyramimonas_sp.AAC.1